jgi:hypothetical protein
LELRTWISGVTARKVAAGAFRVNWTVCLSIALVLPGSSICDRTPYIAFLIASTRSALHTTSSAVISLPSWNLAPGRSLKV